jgi:protein-disulfide isomerase
VIVSPILRACRFALRSLAALCLLALPVAALAAIGEPAEALLADLAEHAPEQVGGGEYRAGDGFTFRYELRGGLVYRLSGQGTLGDENVAFLADLIAAGTGYGESIAQPVATFLGTRAPDLAGRGEVSVGVEQFRLSLAVSTGEAPHEIDFGLVLHEVDAGLFPAPRHTIGPDEARYVIREFSDFQCPFCANFARQAMPMIEQRLLERGDVRFEYHHFPLDGIHANATPAALAAECVTAANSPNDFWAYHDALFEQQRAWQALPDPTGFFLELAADSGLETAGASACLEEGRYRDLVQGSYDLAAGALRLTGTPSVFLNGYKVQDFLDSQAYLDLIELVDAFSTER